MYKKGVIQKMKNIYLNPIKYFFNLGKNYLYMNSIIGKNIHIIFLFYECLNCNKNTKIYRQGYCKKCFFSLPQTNENILKPELSTAHINIEKRDLKWEKKFEIQPHIVYLSITGNLKIGVTRESNIFNRWIDQGSSLSIKICRTPNRYLAGKIELFFKKKISDRTRYKSMLKNNIPKLNLLKIKYYIEKIIPKKYKKYFLFNENYIYSFFYPFYKKFDKIKILKLNKLKEFKKQLVGIKGQYLIFENGYAINIMTHSGFYILLSF